MSWCIPIIEMLLLGFLICLIKFKDLSREINRLENNIEKNNEKIEDLRRCFLDVERRIK